MHTMISHNKGVAIAECLLNKPVVPANWLTDRRIIVEDFTQAAIVQSEGFTLLQVIAIQLFS